MTVGEPQSCSPETGEWIGAPQLCKLTSCGDLPRRIDEMTNGYTCTDSNRLNSQCRLRCRAGHRHNNGKLTKCDQDGNWEFGSQECEKIPECPLNIEIQGDGITFCNGNKPGSTCDVDCPFGYALEGDSVLTCSKDGDWIGNATCIEPWCDPLGKLTYEFNIIFIHSRC